MTNTQSFSQPKNTNRQNKKPLVLAVCLLVLAALALLLIYLRFGPQGAAGEKDITISVQSADGTETVYDIATAAEFLRGAMNDAAQDGLTYAESGGMVITINDERADWNADGAYWAFYVNGEYCQYGIDQQPVADGDDFDIVYTPAE